MGIKPAQEPWPYPPWEAASVLGLGQPGQPRTAGGGQAQRRDPRVAPHRWPAIQRADCASLAACACPAFGLAATQPMKI
jgi:hypothetical protein